MPKNKLLVIATRNAGKTREFARLFEPLGIEVRNLSDYPDIPDIVEDGDTFAANSLIKAKAVSDIIGETTLADDSGLCVDALDGRPGVYSARFAGIGASDADNNAKLLHELNQLAESDRLAAQMAATGGGASARLLSPARFVCALTLYSRTSPPLQSEGACEGYIIDAPRGTEGFGYDPLFYVPALGRTLAELALSQKNEISHRSKAMDKLLELIRIGQN
jgi:XTP/dITP diphosphohydrolase